MGTCMGMWDGALIVGRGSGKHAGGQCVRVPELQQGQELDT
jgi:hypothetical protein